MSSWGFEASQQFTQNRPMPQSPDFQFDVFLSHNTKDKPRVRRLAERLKAAGVRVWFDEWTVKSGDKLISPWSEGGGVAGAAVVHFAGRARFGLGGAGAEHRAVPRSVQRGAPVHPAPTGRL